jgi:hypothetical protein
MVGVDITLDIVKSNVLVAYAKCGQQSRYYCARPIPASRAVNNARYSSAQVESQHLKCRADRGDSLLKIAEVDLRKSFWGSIWECLRPDLLIAEQRQLIVTDARVFPLSMCYLLLRSDINNGADVKLTEKKLLITF